MNILPKKSWHVWLGTNKDIVKADERAAALEEDRKKERQLQIVRHLSLPFLNFPWEDPRRLVYLMTIALFFLSFFICPV